MLPCKLLEDWHIPNTSAKMLSESEYTRKLNTWSLTPKKLMFNRWQIRILLVRNHRWFHRWIVKVWKMKSQTLSLSTAKRIWKQPEDNNGSNADNNVWIDDMHTACYYITYTDTYLKYRIIQCEGTTPKSSTDLCMCQEHQMDPGMLWERQACLELGTSSWDFLPTKAPVKLKTRTQQSVKMP